MIATLTTSMTKTSYSTPCIPDFVLPSLSSDEFRLVIGIGGCKEVVIFGFEGVSEGAMRGLRYDHDKSFELIVATGARAQVR
jgi:hypothetical protein